MICYLSTNLQLGSAVYFSFQQAFVLFTKTIIGSCIYFEIEISNGSNWQAFKWNTSIFWGTVTHTTKYEVITMLDGWSFQVL